MKLLSICDPTRYDKPPLDVPTFYQRLAADPRVEFYHIPTPHVFTSTLPTVQAAHASGDLSYEAFLALGDRANDWLDLADIDVVFCRTLKPYPAHYLDTLAVWEEWTQFTNRPSSKKQQMQLDFLPRIAQGYVPDTLVTAVWTQALAFFEQFQTIVAKQPNSCGGRGVFKIWYDHHMFYVDNIVTGTQTFPQFAEVMAYLQQSPSDSIQFCRYLHRTHAGDKRVVVVDGEIYGGYLRRSRSGHWVNNVSTGGDCTIAPVTQDEMDAIAHTVGYYQALGLHTLGYDFLMDDDGTWRISEINAGNIGGFARLELLTGEPVMERLIRWLIEYAQRSQSGTVSLPRSVSVEAA